MSDQQNLLDHLEEITALTEEKILHCSIPYKVFINEAEALHTHASIDLPSLQAINFNPEKLDRLLSLTGALRTAQSNWEAKKTDKQKREECWRNEAPEMYDLHSEIIDHMGFAFRGDEALLRTLNGIKEGKSKADMIQDMASLAVLGKENAELLQAINFDLASLDTAAQMADHMGGLLGDINGRMYFADDLKLTRDKSYTLCKVLVDEIRTYGKFVFRNNDEKRKAYASKYNRERVTAYRKTKASEAM
ncbi:hypothetical protein [Labilibaculum antarcticum]|uniref:Uncharacterized protein n=1 Tax=Labilibaculum antarcticum TaxID=1717717 RepID=A0A1Y1CLQ3_9BACT|nr:hypothetical protein [Labilibaculum antarcticum]BAX81224.1 hypothetical protein ALGA_2919 [Labilibaculum antarcticum]